MKYDVYYRRVTDGRAPEHVDLAAEYTKGGTFNAENRRGLEQKLFKLMDSAARLAGSTRQIKVGDVIVEHGPTKQTLIYTTNGSWAQVKLVKE